MEAADPPSPAEQHIALAVSGDMPLSALAATERTEANRRINGAISDAVNSTSFANRLAAEGRPVVYVQQGETITAASDSLNTTRE